MDYKYKFEKYKSKYDELLKQQEGSAQILQTAVSFGVGSDVSNIPSPSTGVTLNIEFIVYNDKTKNDIFRKIKRNKKDKVKTNYHKIAGDINYSKAGALTTTTSNYYVTGVGGLGWVYNDQQMFQYFKIPELMEISKDSWFNVFGTTQFDEFDIRQLFYTIKETDTPGQTKKKRKDVVTYKNGWTFYAESGKGLRGTDNPFDVHKGSKVVGIVTLKDAREDAQKANHNGTWTEKWKGVMNKRNDNTLRALVFGSEGSTSGLYQMYYKDDKNKVIYDEVHLYEGVRFTRIVNKVSSNLDYFNLLGDTKHNVRSNGETIMQNLVLAKGKTDIELVNDKNYSWVTETQLDLENCSGCTGFTANIISDGKEGPKIYGILGTRINKRNVEEIKDQRKRDSEEVELAKKCGKSGLTMEEYNALGCGDLEGHEDYLATVKRNIRKTPAKRQAIREDLGLPREKAKGIMGQVFRRDRGDAMKDMTDEEKRKLRSEVSEGPPVLDSKKQLENLKNERHADEEKRKLRSEVSEGPPVLDSKKQLENLKNERHAELLREAKKKMDARRAYATKSGIGDNVVHTPDDVNMGKLKKELDPSSPFKKFGDFSKNLMKGIKDRKTTNTDTIVDSSTASIYNIKAGKYHVSKTETCGALKGKKYRFVYSVDKYSNKIKSRKDIQSCNDDISVYESKFSSSLGTNYSSSSSSDEEDNKESVKGGVDAMGLPLWVPTKRK